MLSLSMITSSHQPPIVSVVGQAVRIRLHTFVSLYWAVMTTAAFRPTTVRENNLDRRSQTQPYLSNGFSEFQK